MRQKYVIGTLVLSIALTGGCAKVAPNKLVEDSTYRRTYPYERPDLYETVYPADKEQRDTLRKEGLARDGAFFH